MFSPAVQTILDRLADERLKYIRVLVSPHCYNRIQQVVLKLVNNWVLISVEYVDIMLEGVYKSYKVPVNKHGNACCDVCVCCCVVSSLQFSSGEAFHLMISDFIYRGYKEGFHLMMSVVLIVCFKFKPVI